MSTSAAASVATGYVPPFAKTTAAVAGTATSLTFASVGTLSYGGGTAAGTSATATTTRPIVDSTGGVDSSSLTEYFFKPYIDAHSLSVPTWRYAYMLWIILGGVIVLWSLVYHLSGDRSGVVGAWFRKWTIRRIVIGGKVKQVEKGGGTVTLKRKKSWTSPTIAQMLAVVGLIALCVCLTVLGNDYIKPTTCTFGGECQYSNGYDNGPPRTTYRVKRRSVVRMSSANSEVPPPQPAARASLQGRGVNNPSGWAPFNDPLLAGPNYDISVNLWASSGRLGLVSYAMIPLVITLALKHWPFNIWATPFLIGYHFDKTAILHRWSGRVIWLFSTAHTLTWGAQLLQDKDPFGRPTLIPAFQYYRFVAGVVAYGLLSIIVVFSFAPFRNRHYEFFWWSHIVLCVTFCVGCILHTRTLLWWPIAGLIIWGAERAFRVSSLVWINSIGFVKRPDVKAANRQSFSLVGAEKEERYSENPAVYGGRTYNSASRYAQDQFEKESLNGPAFSPDHRNDSTYSFNAAQDPYSHPPGYPSPSAPRSPLPRSTSTALSSHHVSTMERQTPSRPPPGFAYAQILPGRTIRLTISTPRSIRWLPGQHTFLTLPAVKMGTLQAHPYTITSVDDRAAGLAPSGGKAAVLEGGSHVVLLIRAQKGFSKSLWDLVVRKRREKASSGAESLDVYRGITLRAFVGLPLGSACRVSWKNYDSVLIICGGTGVTFGISVLDYLCRRMARRNVVSKENKDGRFKATRVRFVWIMREYAHLSWIAPTLRRCLETSQAGQLQVDLFVSRDQTSSDTPPRATPLSHPYPSSQNDQDPFVPPTAPFARQSRAVSHGSLSGEMSDTEENTPLPQEYREIDQNIDSITDLVLFDGEDDAPSPAEAQISSTIRKEGKMRRAVSRRAPGGNSRPLLPPKRPDHSRASSLVKNDIYEGDVGYSHYPPNSNSAPYRNTSYDNGSFADLSQDDYADVRSFGGASSLRQLVGGRPPSAMDLSGDESAQVDMTPEDREDLDVLSELARPGHPQLDRILDEEVAGSSGNTMVACCGPTSLNTVVRHLVSSRINLGKIMKGDPSGNVSLICEDFSF